MSAKRKKILLVKHKFAMKTAFGSEELGDPLENQEWEVSILKIIT